MRAFASTEPLTDDELSHAPVRWPRPSRLARSLLPADRPPRAGKLAAGLQALGIASVGDLLEHLPRDRREARTVATLTPGEQATVAVEVLAIERRPVRRRRMAPLVQ
ncbi:MAG TPA: ATP-dependent DNA helicase RecG, partial [Solirubrobacteraceae bacterium]|nr:ATP-dependent DNA helicase RecG [Solirubrobacteraceae bacterium]